MNVLAVTAQRSIGMSVAMPLGQLVVYAFPVVFVIFSWFAGAGFPYYIDNNETFLSYVHARNLELWNPNEYGWLTAHTTDPLQPAVEDVYTHNPNGPRYLHYLLLRIGVRELAHQLLILSLVGATLTGVLLWHAFSARALLVVPLAVVLDYSGYLSWTVNTYRLWTFVLYFGLVVAVKNYRPLWVGLVTFLLFQVEYGMALFMGVMTTVLAILMHGRRARSLIVASAIGAILSLAVFGTQVLAYKGWDGLIQELAITFARRGTYWGAAAPGTPGTFVYQAWHGMLRLALEIAMITYNRAVLIVATAGILISVRTLLRGDVAGERLFLARLTIATVAGAIATSCLLYDYFTDGFVASKLPLAVFLIAPSVGVVGLEIQYPLALRWHSPHFGWLCSGLALLPLIVSSAMHFHLPIAVDVFRLLQTEYRERTIVSPYLGPHLAFALAGGRAGQSGGVESRPEALQRLDSLRDTDGALTYICVDLWYLRERALLGERLREMPSVCDQAAASLAARGHTVVHGGVGWVVMQLNRGESSARHPKSEVTTVGAPPADAVGSGS